MERVFKHDAIGRERLENFGSKQKTIGIRLGFLKHLGCEYPVHHVLQFIIVWVKSKEAPANAILEPDPTWDCPEGFWAVPVEVGLSDNSKVEITRGLAEGQEVFIGYQNPDEMYY